MLLTTKVEVVATVCFCNKTIVFLRDDLDDHDDHDVVGAFFQSTGTSFSYFVL
jgi:hypothetical protein